MRPLTLCALLCALPSAGQAEDAAPGDAPPTETVVRLRVQPMAAPTPVLRYQLLPEMRELSPGNPIQGYLVCFMEQNHFYYDKTEVDNREKWQTAPLKDLPLKELHDYGGIRLRGADYAARLDKPDWQILLPLRRDGFYTLLPDVQQMRKLAAALKVRFRSEIAERRFDDALGTAKTMFAMARHLGEHPTFIGDLVAVAVGSLAIGPVDEMIQQPGCPNLYWALTDLPAPFIDLRQGRLGERDWAEVEFRQLDDKAPMSDAQVKQFLDRIRTLAEADKESQNTGFIKGDPAEWVAAQAKNEERVRASRMRLIESGLAEDRVKQLPAQQVILLDEKLDYEIQRDRVLAMTAVPYWEAEKVLAAGNEKLQKGERLFPLWPALIKVRQAAARLDQRLALLRCVEALRIHAAENDGKLPAKLDDVKLPLPVDPITGKPFSYQLDGDTATLHGTPPAGREKEAQFNVRYEVTISK
jgi:hypothetical protein